MSFSNIGRTSISPQETYSYWRWRPRSRELRDMRICLRLMLLMFSKTMCSCLEIRCIWIGIRLWCLVRVSSDSIWYSSFQNALTISNKLSDSNWNCHRILWLVSTSSPRLSARAVCSISVRCMTALRRIIRISRWSCSWMKLMVLRRYRVIWFKPLYWSMTCHNSRILQSVLVRLKLLWSAVRTSRISKD